MSLTYWFPGVVPNVHVGVEPSQCLSVSYEHVSGLPIHCCAVGVEPSQCLSVNDDHVIGLHPVFPILCSLLSSPLTAHMVLAWGGCDGAGSQPSCDRRPIVPPLPASKQWPTTVIDPHILHTDRGLYVKLCPAISSRDASRLASMTGWFKSYVLQGGGHSPCEGGMLLESTQNIAIQKAKMAAGLHRDAMWDHPPGSHKTGNHTFCGKPACA